MVLVHHWYRERLLGRLYGLSFTWQSQRMQSGGLFLGESLRYMLAFWKQS